ncbi:MAG: hypothetical protein PHE25_05800 [Candidatus Gracilibacteria bacterium]|nr:hypothetical protein [Candidatus Gracilibacteria bacterium]
MSEKHKVERPKEKPKQEKPKLPYDGENYVNAFDLSNMERITENIVKNAEKMQSAYEQLIEEYDYVRKNPNGGENTQIALGNIREIKGFLKNTLQVIRIDISHIPESKTELKAQKQRISEAMDKFEQKINETILNGDNSIAK